MTALLAPATFDVEQGRRISIGHTPPAGACAQLPAWWSAENWTKVQVASVVYGAAPKLRGTGVDPHTAVIVARAMARFADVGTGRGCRPTRRRIAELAGLSERHVARVWKVLEDLKLIKKVVEGKWFISRKQRLEAWRRGSSHRHLAAEFALLGVRRYAQPAEQVGDAVTPTASKVVKSLSSVDKRFFGGKTETRTAAPRPPATKNGPPGPAYPIDLRTRRLVNGVRERVPWLRTVSPRRLTCLHRFAAAGWTPRDVLIACDEVLRARHWTVPDRIDQPAAYLAALLRGVDPADRPGAFEEARLAEEQARREWLWQTTFGTALCPHGQPGGDLPHPVDGHLACPLCRSARS